MKKLFFLFAAGVLTAACEEFNTPYSGGGGGSTSTVEYYVRYTIKSPGTYYYFSDIYYNDVNGTGSAEKNHSVSSWTVTIGPVKKGFKASVRNERGTGNNIIEVSKNGSPFAQKATGTNSASYTINY